MDESSVPSQAFERPSEQEIKSKWRELYNDPLVSSSRLKEVALSKSGLGQVDADGGITLRSVYWRHYHGLLPSPTSLDSFADTLFTSRQSYSQLRKRYLLAPDGRWASDCSPPLSAEEGSTSDTPGAGPSRTTTPLASDTEAGKSWDPLSLESESPWKTWFAHLELRQTIRQDVDRTFPDIEYFRSEQVRRCLVSILFLYAVLSPDVGYRQGMHELLAVCYWVIDRDSNTPPDGDSVSSPLARDPVDDAMQATLDRRYVEHDAFATFAEIMKSAKAFYEWRAEETPRNRNTSAPAAQAPVITRCQHIHNDLIGRIDPQLWERLENEGVEAQIWAIRWLRLIFTRELPFGIALQLWDGIFAHDPGLELLDFICVAMLLLIRNELIEADYPTLLTQLLHYPAPSSTYPFNPSLILSQAIFLRNNVSPASGVEVVIQNQDLLGVKAQPPERAVDPLSETTPRARAHGRGPRGRPPPPTSQPQAQGRAGVQGLAQGWIDRAQAAGLDKAVLSAVSDLRRNLPDTSSAYSYLPNLPFSPQSPTTRDGSFSSIPSNVSALPNRNSPTYFPRPLSSPLSAPTTAPSEVMLLQSRLRERERQMAELRLVMLSMGKAMSGYLAIRPEGNEAGDAKKGLERVRDTLLDAGGRNVEDLVKEWVSHERLEKSSAIIEGPEAPSLRQGSSMINGQGHGNDHGNGGGRQEAPPALSTLPAPGPGPIPTNSFPSPSFSRPVPQPHRGVGPLASLPRTSHPISGGNGRSSTTGTRREADPLAGLGVTSTLGSTGTARHKSSTADSGDPLGVGR